ncbi:CAP domain-containing protein [Comamonas thiooxydans]|uniref:CAP domain-containing protein n=1 Tax=Comamonas thiooxydans TaxID=363952 RepID=UPI000A2D6351|nr:hypothetical protein [Comamonas thiooxydans]BDR09200.1 CAP domain-containing protein [Comamonas thiooxydans]
MKISSTFSLVAIACALAACGGGGGDSGSTPSEAKPIPETPKANYPTEIPSSNYSDVNRAQIFDIINRNRTTCGFSSIKQNSLLDISAQGHAGYLQANKTMGHNQISTNPGFTGSDLLARAKAAGYQPSVLGEIAGGGDSGSLFAGTSNSGIEAPVNPAGRTYIRGLFATVYHLAGAVSEWNEMGVGYSMSSNLTSIPGKTVFYSAAVVNFGTPSGSSSPVYGGGEIRSFPCDGITDLSPIFTSEAPNPYPNRDFNVSPMGHPVILTSGNGGEITVTSASMTDVASGALVDTKIFNASDDVHKMLTLDQAFVIPNQPLKPNTAYNVSVDGSSDGKSFRKAIRFTTGNQS